MCGICGFTGQENRKILADMTGELYHRGPDDEGFYSAEGVNFGFRRLSIIDLENGHQPMTSNEKDVVIVFNGEIYNYKSLKSELERDGAVFLNRSDTEVVLQLYRKYGLTFVDRLNGMYAIALYDRSKRVLCLITDRFLKKPLFYHLLPGGGGIAFASEIKSLLRYPGYRRELNYEAMHHYFTFKHVPRPHTIFKGIDSLNPAEIIRYDIEKGTVSKENYWEIDYSSEHADIDEREATSTYLKLFDEAVERRLVADVEVGAYLSGGLDSSAIVAVMSKYYPKRIKTFSMVYGKGDEGGALFNKESDRHYARMMSKKYDTEHIEIQANMDTLPDDLDDIIRCADEPFSGVFTYYYLSKKVREHAKVVLSGDGGDEHFGSYMSHLVAYPIHHYLRLRKTVSDMTGDDRRLLGGFDPEYIAGLAETEECMWRIKLNVHDETDKNGLYSQETLKRTEGASTLEWYRAEFNRCRALSPLNRVLEMEIKTKFSNEMTMLVDRYNMANSVECRCPFVDYRLMEFTAKLPDRFKLVEGDGKYIHKKAMVGLLPHELMERNKEGLIMPIYELILSKWDGWCHEVLSRKNIDRYGILSGKKVADFLDSKGSQRPYLYAQKVWNLMVFQRWLDLYFN